MNRAVLLLPLGVFVALVIYFAIALNRDPRIIPSVLIDKPAPNFTLGPIEGFDEGLTADDLAGEVSLVNFFGSWCVACLIEHPILMEIAEAGEIPIYGVDWKDPPGAGAAWLEKHGNPYTKIGNDYDGRVAIDFGITGAPETFVIDAKGRIRYKQVGPITEQIWKLDIAPIIEEIRNEAPGNS